MMYSPHGHRVTPYCLLCLIPDDIPSDAEAEARLHQSEDNEALCEEDETAESLGIASDIGTRHE